MRELSYEKNINYLLEWYRYRSYDKRNKKEEEGENTYVKLISVGYAPIEDVLNADL